MNLRLFIDLLEEYEKTFTKGLYDAGAVNMIFTHNGEAFEVSHHMGFLDSDGSVGPHIDFTLRPLLK